MARLDRLGDAKAVAQVGAVLGREFGFAELLSVSERPVPELESALARLCDAELLHARGFGAEASYTFKHALVQQAAYESLLKSRRRELHRRAAEVASRADDTPRALLAQHWEVAGEAARAVAAWQEAAEHARSSAASFEVAEHYRRALAVLATLPESPERDQQELALQYPLSSYLLIAKGAESPELHAARARARELAERVGDATMAVSVLSAFWAAALVRGEFRTALTISEQMLEIAEREGALRPRVVAHADKAACHLYLGELAAAREHGERVLELYEPDALRDDPLDRRVLVLSFLAQAGDVMARMGEARKREAEMLAAAQARGVVTDLAFAQNSVGFHAISRREPEGVLERGRSLDALCAEHKLEMFAATNQVLTGWATACLGNREEGIALLREGLRRQQATGVVMARSLQVALLVEAQAAAGRVSEAFATLDDAFGALGEGELWRPDLLRLRGDLLAQQGEDLEGAESAFREAIERARAMQALLFEVRAATGLARLLQRRGRPAEARELLEPIYQRFPEAAECRDGREAKATLDALGVVSAR
jgi:tetratricopeptide (TPR) repeat protein